MSLTIFCARCREELDQPGGLLFSEPRGNQLHRKVHLCAPCFIVVEEFARWRPSGPAADPDGEER